MFGVSNPCITRDIKALMIFESLGAVWAVESLRCPCYQFVDDFGVPRAYLGCPIRASP
jgi:hypothetical protein